MSSRRRDRRAARWCRAAKQVAAGKPFFGAEVTLSRGEAVLSRMVVSVAASPLKNG